MVHRCCISSCKMNVRVAEAKGLSYHCFPIKDPHREKWIQAILPHVEKPESFKVVQGYTRICSRHFRIKEYSMDSKKRARLNSNAVPSVFPRKTSPVIVQTPIESRKFKPEKINGLNTQPGGEEYSIQTDEPSLASVNNVSSEDDDVKSVLVESATSSNDQMILNLLNSVSVEGGCSDQNSSIAGSQSEDLNSEDSCDEKQEQTKRKRRKWNRTAFARCSKSKQKKSLSPTTPTCVSSDPTAATLDEDGLGDINLITTLLDDYSRNNSIDLEAELRVVKVELDGTKGSNVCPDLNQLQIALDKDVNHSASSFSCLSVSDNLQVEVLNLISIEEQELLQSIQAVSLDCGEADMNLNMKNIHIDPNDFVPAASLATQAISNETPADTKVALDAHLLFDDPIIDSLNDVTLSLADLKKLSLNRKSSLQESPSLRVPSASEIEKLASEFHSSLLTGPNLCDAFDLHLSEHDLTLPAEAFSSEPSLKKKLNDNRSSGAKSSPETPIKKESATPGPSEPASKSETKGSQKSGQRKGSVLKSKLVGIAKKPKNMDKCFGKFSVERFRDSDKDIEYYTSFPSYTHFEAFFNSLESHVEKLKVTDIMHGVADLIRNQQILENSKSPNSPQMKEENNSTGTGEEQKRRPIVGRSMSRIDELFMTLIRLKRRLPEKVLGHMFYVSQPTVSRTVRAWTMLLCKLLEPMPIPSISTNDISVAGDCQPPKYPQKVSKCSVEHNYFTNRGIYVPDSFRQLFLSDLAATIVACPHTPRGNSTLNSSNAKTTAVTVNNNVYQKDSTNGNRVTSAVSSITSLPPQPCVKCTRKNSSCHCASISNLNEGGPVIKQEVLINHCGSEIFDVPNLYQWTLITQEKD